MPAEPDTTPHGSTPYGSTPHGSTPHGSVPVEDAGASDGTARPDPGGPSAGTGRTGPGGLVGIEARPGVPKPDPILVADGVVRQFGGLVAVEVEHLEVQRGAITALIGPNGAGKTTFFNLLTGFDRPDKGRWSFDGRNLARVPAHRVARQGMVRTFQLTKALSRMTVMDNMRLGATGQRGENFFRALVPAIWRGQQKTAYEITR